MNNIQEWQEGPLPWEPCARIIEDSISPNGRRLTTFEMRFHRFVLAEVNTHTLMSRNSASSRAMPLRSKNREARTGTLDRLEDNGPAFPLKWPQEQPGMQGSDEQVYDIGATRLTWEWAMSNAIQAAEVLVSMGLHKSVVNRIIEPFTWHTAVISAVDWNGFFAQRSWNHTKLAQPEFAAVATQVEDLYLAGCPTPLETGQFHTPYILDEERESFSEPEKAKLSAARCARVSYLTQDGRRDIADDYKLYERLTTALPPHASPLQHPATPDEENETEYIIRPSFYGMEGQTHVMGVPIVGNARGWMQLRHIVMGF